MSGDRDLTADVDIDMAGLLSEVWKRKWLVFALTVLAGVGLFFTFAMVSPRYKSSARVLIEQRESVFTRQGSNDPNLVSSQFDEQAIGSQVQVLTSDDIALKVIDSLGLAKRAEFNQDAKPSLVDRFLARIGLKSAPSSTVEEADTLKAFNKRLTVYAADKSRVLVIEFWSHDPQLAQEVPNAVAKEYLAVTKQAKLQANEAATNWLGPEIEQLRGKVRDAEAKVAAFRANSDLLVGSNNSLLATQQLSEVSSELSRLRAQRSAADAKAQSIRAALANGASLDVIPEVSSSPLIQRLRERQVALRTQISDLSTTLLPSHPRIKALRAQLADLDHQIRQAAGNILKGLENNVGVVRDQERVLLKEVDRLKAEAGRVGEAEVELRALEREATAQRSLLESYLSRYREAASRQNRQYLPVDARIISRAVRPVDPYFPKLVPFTIAGMLTTMILVIVGILAWALMTGRAFKPVGVVDADLIPERVEAASADRPAFEHELPFEDEGRYAGDEDVPFDDRLEEDLPFDDRHDEDLPQVESPPFDEQDYAMEPAEPAHLDDLGDQAPGLVEPLSAESDQPTAAEAELTDADPIRAQTELSVPASSSGLHEPEIFAFRHAAAAIGNLGHARVAVVSPAGDPGSVVAWMLARELAGDGGTVAIVDLTGTAVTSRQMLGEVHSAGLRDLLSGAARFGEAIHRDRLSQVDVLPPGHDGGEKAAVAAGRLASIADAMTGTYDFLLFDCGYTGPEGLKLVADGETVVIISCEGASPEEAFDTAREFSRAGFVDTIMVRLDPSERKVVPTGAAA